MLIITHCDAEKNLNLLLKGVIHEGGPLAFSDYDYLAVLKNISSVDSYNMQHVFQS